jgi:hypothetical protein
MAKGVMWFAKVASKVRLANQARTTQDMLRTAERAFTAMPRGMLADPGRKALSGAATGYMVGASGVVAAGDLQGVAVGDIPAGALGAWAGVGMALEEGVAGALPAVRHAHWKCQLGIMRPV